MTGVYVSIFKQHIEAMAAYQPPLDGRDSARHLLLDFNERTLPIADVVQTALVDYIGGGRLQMYPAYGDITALIGEYCGVPEDQVMITNGSDQGIDLVIRAASSEGDEAIIPAPAFPIYAQCARVENLKIVAPAYTREGGFPTAQVLQAIGPRTAVICIANPNNPSGTVVLREDIIAIAKRAPEAAILVDECYFEYLNQSVSDLVASLPNLVVTRTFSKTWGMPSLRFGYIISAKHNIVSLLNVRGPYDVNQLAVVAARAALACPEHTQAYVTEVMTEAKPLLERYLRSLGVDFWPSGGNYLWAFPPSPNEVYESLVAENIFVRPKADLNGELGLRITVGTVAQTNRLIAALGRAFKGEC